MSDIKEKITHTVGVTIGSIAVLIFLGLIIAAGLLISGFVVSTMWAWFLVPIGLPVLGFVNAVGVALLVRYLTWQHNSSKKEENDNERLVRQILLAFIYPFIVLGLGWAVHSFM